MPKRPPMACARCGQPRRASGPCPICTVINVTQASARIIVVVGPPCSGKTTLVRERKRDGDIVIDWDAIGVALGSTEEHRHHPALMPFIAEARDALLARLLTRENDIAHAWIITTGNTAEMIYHERIVMDTPVDECLRRADADGRTEDVKQAIRDWRLG